MDPKTFLTTSRVLIVAGKGGVGKTTVTAVLARAAVSLGIRTHVVAIDEESPLGSLLGLAAALTTKVVTVSPGLSAQLVTPIQALDDYLRDHGMRGVSRQLGRFGVLDLVSSAAPGIDDILVLAKIKQLDVSRYAELLIIDAPAAGHAIPFLRAPRALREIIPVGPVNTQAVEAGALLADPARCRVMLVTLAEETPINEAIETAFALEEDIGITLAPIVVNALYPEVPGLTGDYVDPTAAPPEAATKRKPRSRSASGALLVPGSATGIGARPIDPGGGSNSADAACASQGLVDGIRVNDRLRLVDNLEAANIATDQQFAAARADAARFRFARLAAQQENRERLSAELPLPQIALPFVFEATLSQAAIAMLAARFVNEVTAL